MLCTTPQNDVSSFLKPNFASLNLGVHLQRVRQTEVFLVNTENLTRNTFCGTWYLPIAKSTVNELFL